MSVTFQVRVTPRASKDELLGWQEDVLRVRLQAPPVEGKANRELVRVLAEALGVTKGAVDIKTGLSGRRKTVSVEGLTLEEVRTRLERGQGRLGL